MKVRAMMRVAKTASRTGYRITAGVKPSDEPITDSYGNALPTVAFALMLDIPDTMFERAKRVLAEIELQEADVQIPVSVVGEEQL